MANRVFYVLWRGASRALLFLTRCALRLTNSSSRDVLLQFDATIVDLRDEMEIIYRKAQK